MIRDWSNYLQIISLKRPLQRTTLEEADGPNFEAVSGAHRRSRRTVTVTVPPCRSEVMALLQHAYGLLTPASPRWRDSPSPCRRGHAAGQPWSRQSTSRRKGYAESTQHFDSGDWSTMGPVVRCDSVQELRGTKGGSLSAGGGVAHDTNGSSVFISVRRSCQPRLNASPTSLAAACVLDQRDADPLRLPSRSLVASHTSGYTKTNSTGRLAGKPCVLPHI